jgi:hypothetical protein
MDNRKFKHFYLYKRVQHAGSLDKKAFDIKNHTEEDFLMDIYLSNVGGYREDGKINFFIDKDGDEFWTFLRDFQEFLKKNYKCSFLFFTGDNGASLIELTAERD